MSTEKKTREKKQKD